MVPARGAGVVVCAAVNPRWTVSSEGLWQCAVGPLVLRAALATEQVEQMKDSNVPQLPNEPLPPQKSPAGDLAASAIKACDELLMVARNVKDMLERTGQVVANRPLYRHVLTAIANAERGQ